MKFIYRSYTILENETTRRHRFTDHDTSRRIWISEHRNWKRLDECI